MLNFIHKHCSHVFTYSIHGNSDMGFIGRMPRRMCIYREMSQVFLFSPTPLNTKLFNVFELKDLSRRVGRVDSAILNNKCDLEVQLPCSTVDLLPVAAPPIASVVSVRSSGACVSKVVALPCRYMRDPGALFLGSPRLAPPSVRCFKNGDLTICAGVGTAAVHPTCSVTSSFMLVAKTSFYPLVLGSMYCCADIACS